MEHILLLGILITLIVATWAAIYVYQIQKTYDYLFLKPLFHYCVFYDIAVFSLLITIYFTINFPKNYLQDNFPVFSDLGYLFVTLFEIGLVYSLFRVYLGLKDWDIPVKIKFWIFVGIGVFVLSFGVRLVLLPEGTFRTFLRSIQLSIYNNFLVLEIPILIALVVGRKKEKDRRKIKLRRSLAWLYFFRYFILIGIFILLVVLNLRGAEVGPRTIRYSMALILCIFFSLIPYIWIKFFFKKYAESMLVFVEDREILDSIYDKYNISKREQDILKLILDGKSNKEIEAALFISYHTVKNHVYNLYQKLGVKNRYELVHFITKFRKD